MKHSILYTLSIALVVVLLFSVVSLISASDFDPANDRFLPMIFGKGQSSNPRGALYVFSSVGTTNGNGSGRSGMNAICSATDIESFFCDEDMIRNAFGTTGVYFATPFIESWVDNNFYTPYTCLGWTSDNSVNPPQGKKLTSNATEVVFSPCNSVLNVACCKWIP